MNARFMGDSYDIVKQSLLKWLTPLGPWAVHPMFTDENLNAAGKNAFSRILGAPLLTCNVLTASSDRSSYLECARRSKDHVFLDPDTGLRLQVTRGYRAPVYLFLFELVWIAHRSRRVLTLVFDQSLPRGKERAGIEEKLRACSRNQLHSIAYVSHACFILVGQDLTIIEEALELLRRESRLPENRFLIKKAA